MAHYKHRYEESQKKKQNRPTIMGVPVPGLVHTNKYSLADTGLTKKDLGLAAFGLGVSALALKGLKDSKKSKIKPPPSKPKFSNVAIPVGKPKRTRQAQTLKEEKGKNPIPGRKGSGVTGSKI